MKAVELDFIVALQNFAKGPTCPDARRILQARSFNMRAMVQTCRWPALIMVALEMVDAISQCDIHQHRLACLAQVAGEIATALNNDPGGLRVPVCPARPAVQYKEN